MTRGEMIAYALDRCSLSSGEVARVAIIRAQLDEAYAQVVVELGLNQRRADLATVADDASIDLPADWGRTRSMFIGGVELVEVTWRELLTREATSPASGPRVYVMDGPSRLQVWPVPAKTDLEAGTIWYDAYPTAMASDSAAPEAIPKGFHRLLPERVIEQVWMSEEEPGLAQVAKAFADILEARLRTQANRRSGQRPPQIPIPGNR